MIIVVVACFLCVNSIRKSLFFKVSSKIDFELKHKEIIERFGGYPHRNEVLGGVSMEKELIF